MYRCIRPVAVASGPNTTLQFATGETVSERMYGLVPEGDQSAFEPVNPPTESADASASAPTSTKRRKAS